MAIYVPLPLYMNHRFLLRLARPSLLCTIMMVIDSFVYVGFAISGIVWKIGQRLGESEFSRSSRYRPFALQK